MDNNGGSERGGQTGSAARAGAMSKAHATRAVASAVARRTFIANHRAADMPSVSALRQPLKHVVDPGPSLCKLISTLLVTSFFITRNMLGRCVSISYITSPELE